MARYRLSALAKTDIASILRTSEERWGQSTRTRYQALLAAAMRRVASRPQDGATVDRSDLSPGLRSFHLRHSRDHGGEAAVANPVHVIFYRKAQSNLVEIVRVRHERMEPSRHLGPVVEP